MVRKRTHPAIAKYDKTHSFRKVDRLAYAAVAFAGSS